MISEHRSKIIGMLDLFRNCICTTMLIVMFVLLTEATLEKMQNEECDYFTSEEFEYHVCMNIDRLIREQEEEEMRKYEIDEELRKAEEEYFRGQIQWKNQQTAED